MLLCVVALNSAGIAARAAEPTNAQEAQKPRGFVLRHRGGTLPDVGRAKLNTRLNQRLVADELTYYGDRECGRKDSLGKLAVGIRVFVSDSRELYTFVVHYPPAREGDFVPLFGDICRVDEVKSNDPDKPSLATDEPGEIDCEVKFTTVSAKTIGCESVANSLAIPVSRFAARRHGEWHQHGYTIEVERIETVGGEKKCHLRIRTTNIVETANGPEGRAGPAFESVVRIGDRLEIPSLHRLDKNGKKEVLLPSEAFLVRDIVAADRARKIMGWISLQPQMDKWPARAPE
ncbi:MAG: hypothetical protein HZA46_13630 [Planctomycetales bacterium]|nr:hypothetical protein [Planctomycetales bacterium]